MVVLVVLALTLSRLHVSCAAISPHLTGFAARQHVHFTMLRERESKIRIRVVVWAC